MNALENTSSGIAAVQMVNLGRERNMISIRAGQ